MDIFSGRLVRLAHMSKEDLVTFKKWFRNYEFTRLMSIDAAVPVTDESEDAWYEQAIKAKDEYHFSIRLLETDALIGACSIDEINLKNRFGTVGIGIGEQAYWGKGYGSDAMELLLRFGFNELNLNRMQLLVFADNSRAVRSYKRSGFVIEGTARELIFREGAFKDVHYMAILADEWRKRPKD